VPPIPSQPRSTRWTGLGRCSRDTRLLLIAYSGQPKPVDIRYEVLGTSGIEVSRLCLGSMMFGRLGNRGHDDCLRIIHRALDAGINFIDTADVHSAGESKEIVGESFRGRRDDIIVAHLEDFSAEGAVRNCACRSPRQRSTS
jgi:hypothetical protein